jgi:hypothetical protein
LRAKIEEKSVNEILIRTAVTIFRQGYRGTTVSVYCNFRMENGVVEIGQERYNIKGNKKVTGKKVLREDFKRK